MVLEGKFIEIEGQDGSGKTTQAQLLANRLGAVLVREPGGTQLGESIRQILLDKQTGAISYRAEAMLFMAARAELVSAVIGPALRAGNCVVADRFSQSTFAYQGYGRGLDINDLAIVNDWAVGNVKPDMVVYIDVPGEELQRRTERKHRDRMESDRRLLEGARRYFDDQLKSDSNWLSVGGTGPVHEVTERLYEAVVSRLGKNEQ